MTASAVCGAPADVYCNPTQPTGCSLTACDTSCRHGSSAPVGADAVALATASSGVVVSGSTAALTGHTAHLTLAAANVPGPFEQVPGFALAALAQPSSNSPR